jgi:hypothetical protein
MYNSDMERLNKETIQFLDEFQNRSSIVPSDIINKYKLSGVISFMFNISENFTKYKDLFVEPSFKDNFLNLYSYIISLFNYIVQTDKKLASDKTFQEILSKFSSLDLISNIRSIYEQE